MNIKTETLNYLDINKKLWNEKTKHHIDSTFYDNKSFIEGRNSLNKIELDILGDVTGKSILHLQCHFGQDTISLSRMGAKSVGVDLSDGAIAKAKELAIETNTDAEFICCDIYNLPNVLDKKFDIVFTSYGTIGWLPDINKWAEVVDHFLKPGGQFLIAEFHPVVWMYDDHFTHVKYKYSNNGPIHEVEEGTYADVNADIKAEFVCWNHGLAEVMSSLLDQGLVIKQFKEYDYSPYSCFNNYEEFESGKYRVKAFGDKIPYVYALLVEKPII